MAYTKPTLADLKQSLADRHDGGDIPTDSSTLSLWIRLFNRGVEYCIRKLGIVKSTSLTTSGGTVALPDDFVKINRVYDANDNLISLITKEISVKAGTSEDVYWITGDFVNGFYFNTPDDETYTIYYTYRPSPMSADTDVCQFQDEEAITAYAYGMLRKSESDPFEDANQALGEVDARLSEIASQYNTNDKPLGFTLDANA
ncbi:MAG TPA: hypothetical protein ENL05_01055 [Candidatus Moranbacteria bacterium]|nr:hypothetical protein [Candidatus Moranbacteria bacterium]